LDRNKDYDQGDINDIRDGFDELTRVVEVEFKLHETRRQIVLKKLKQTRTDIEKFLKGEIDTLEESLGSRNSNEKFPLKFESLKECYEWMTQQNSVKDKILTLSTEEELKYFSLYIVKEINQKLLNENYFNKKVHETISNKNRNEIESIIDETSKRILENIINDFGR